MVWCKIKIGVSHGLIGNIYRSPNNSDNENEKMIEKKKWFVTDVIFKSQFDRFGNAYTIDDNDEVKINGDVEKFI